MGYTFADYAKAAETAINVLRNSECRKIPVDLNASGIIGSNLRISTYSETAKLWGCSTEDVASVLGSLMGASVKNQNNFIIYLNYNLSDGAIRFTCAHELGHYYMEHFEDSFEADKSADYTRKEREANCFARNLLMPVNLVKQVCKDFEVSEENILRVSLLFGVSKAAAKARLDFAAADSKCLEKSDLSFLSEFGFSSDILCPECQKPASYSSFCENCSSEITSGVIVVPGEKAYETHNCIMCGERLGGEAFCSFCGFPSANVCTNPACAEITDVGAVFCRKCGNVTVRGMYVI